MAPLRTMKKVMLCCSSVFSPVEWVWISRGIYFREWRNAAATAVKARVEFWRKVSCINPPPTLYGSCLSHRLAVLLEVHSIYVEDFCPFSYGLVHKTCIYFNLLIGYQFGGCFLKKVAVACWLISFPNH